MIKKVLSVKGFEGLRIVYRTKMGDGVYGMCTGSQNLIELSLKQNTTQEMMDSSLFHELLHLTIYKAGWSEILETNSVVEEGLVIMLENSLKQIVKFEYEEIENKTKVN